MKRSFGEAEVTSTRETLKRRVTKPAEGGVLGEDADPAGDPRTESHWTLRLKVGRNKCQGQPVALGSSAVCVLGLVVRQRGDHWGAEHVFRVDGAKVTGLGGADCGWWAGDGAPLRASRIRP